MDDKSRWEDMDCASAADFSLSAPSPVSGSVEMGEEWESEESLSEEVSSAESLLLKKNSKAVGFPLGFLFPHGKPCRKKFTGGSHVVMVLWQCC